MRPKPVEILLAVSAAAVAGLVWGTDIPLGVPGEWEWHRAPPATSLFLTLLTLLIVGACYAGYVWIGSKRLADSGPGERAAWLAGLAVAGFAWLWTIQEAAPEGFQLSKAVWVLYFPGPSGYFTEARNDERPLHAFLADYERRMREGDVLHIGTHPPGLIVAFRGMLAACRGSPGLTNLIIDSEPDSVRTSFAALAETVRPGTPPLLRPEQAALWLAALLAQGLAALTVVPLYGLLRQNLSSTVGWLAASLWPTVPAVAVFLPKSDAFFPCLTVLIAWLWLTGCDKRSPLRCLATGFAIWLALFLSLAFLPIAFLIAVATIWQYQLSSPAPLPAGDVPARGLLRTLAPWLAWATLGFIMPILVLRFLAGINLPVVWWLNFRNHAGFYQQFSRTYWKWLPVNPLEFSIAAGLPLVIVAATAVIRQVKTKGWRSCGTAAGFLATWGILWLSGKNLGEAARLWILLTPCFVWIAGPAFDGEPSSNDGQNLDGTADRRLWFVTLALQLLVSAAIVMRVVGFQYG